MTTTVDATIPTRPGHTPAVHAADGNTWATCSCGWTSSMYAPEDLEAQIRRHLKPWLRS